MEQNQAQERNLQKKKQLDRQLQVMTAGHKIVEEAMAKRQKTCIPANERLIPVNEIFTAPAQQVFISEEDRVLFQLSSARQFLKVQDQPHVSNATDKAKETVRTWLYRDLETYSPEENFGELKESLEFLHVQNLLPEDLVSTFRKMFDSIHDHLDQYCEEKEELHKSTRSLHDEGLTKIRDGVQICEPYETELQECNFGIVKLEGELAALRQGKAEVIKKIQGVMKGVEPIKMKLEEDAARADQVRLKTSKLDAEVESPNSLWSVMRKAINSYFNFDN